MAVKKTNNDSDRIEGKIRLRIESLPKKKEIRVLDCFSGEGLLWKEVAKRVPEKTIRTLGIDKNRYNKINLKGDNIKFLLSLPLETYDIIDLDAWGSPISQLEILKRKGYKGIVHLTFIQTMNGGLQQKMLFALGYTKPMIQKIPSLFNTNGYEKLLAYLSVMYDVKQVRYTGKDRKHYLWFEMK
jgi:hypothetical protein